jgi:4-carboxymuconolactone decarboxylase
MSSRTLRILTFLGGEDSRSGRSISLAIVAPAALMAAAALLGATLTSLPVQAQQSPPDLKALGLAGNRFAPPTWEQMTPEQRQLIENVLAGPRDSLGGPFNVLLRSPAMGDKLQDFGASMRFLDSMPATLRELAIIVTARHWTSEYEWQAHARAAAQAGLDAAVIRAIAEGRKPAALKPDEKIVYDFCTELLGTHEVGDATFAAAKGLLGERGVVDLIALMGYYQTVAMLLNVDRHPLPAGAQPQLAPLR